MRIADLATQEGRAGSHGSWEAVRLGNQHLVYHYNTLMLRFTIDHKGRWDGNLDTVQTDLGRGSVSDQNGMNTLFKKLGIPLRYNRAGGAEITCR